MAVLIDVLIVGGGPAGLEAALRLWEKGIRDLLIVDRNPELGGILNQCIHDGFGLISFGKALTGPEYAAVFVNEVKKRKIPYLENTAVLHLSENKTAVVCSPAGVEEYQAKAVILAMGCRERSLGALAIPGTRPSGIYTAGLAQKYINLQNTMIGKEAVILGSGDIGLIMARRLTLEGVHVKAVFELMPYANGLPRNIAQCLDDYEIPLYLGETVTEIRGKSRLESVIVHKVDVHGRPIEGTGKEVSCDTLILSVGLLPENELAREAGIRIDPLTQGAVVDVHFQTSVPGIFAAGNVLHVHDLADDVSDEAKRMADAAAWYVQRGSLSECRIRVSAGAGIANVVPQKVSSEQDAELTFRVKKPIEDAVLYVTQNDAVLGRKKYQKLLPAVMERVILPKEKLLGNTGQIQVFLSETVAAGKDKEV